ncbi:MAG: DMT family transporter [Pseudomonadota bacterium]
MQRSTELIPALAVAVAAAAWGIYWLPQRALEGAGLTGGWATLGQYLVPLALMAPVALVRWRQGKSTGVDMIVIGVLTGGAIACYANSFLLTDVVRALLLFYITPVWGTLIECAVHRHLPTRARWVALLLALAGLWVVFAEDTGIPWPQNAGDWLALTGGLMIAAGAARLNAVKPAGMFPQLFAYFLYGSIIAGVLAWLLGAHLGPTPSGGTMLGVLPWLILLALLFLIPSNAILLWGATRIRPGMFGILILSEIIVGMVSAALWAGEAFGWREIVGGALILAAGTLEIMWARNRGGQDSRSPHPGAGLR